MGERGRLGEFLKEVISWRWDDFCRAEQDSSYTGLQSTVFSLVRTTSEGSLGAIKLAIDRVDGKVETPVKIEYPKIYFTYPKATSVASLPAGDIVPIEEPGPESEPEPDDEPEETAATLTLRQTLDRMAEQPRVLVQLILSKKREVERALKDDAEVKDVPLVKSVIAANLLNLASKNKIEAINEVFEQMDGKLVETIRILGDDLYITQYALQAPAGAIRNKDGIYQLSAKEVEEIWKQKLSKN